MVKFDALLNKSDIVETKPSEFHAEIYSDECFSKEKAKSFWNDVFGKKGTFDEEEYLPEIFGCSEDEFKFIIDYTDKLTKCLNGFETDSWNEQSLEEKKERIDRLTKLIGEQLELKEMPYISYFEGPDVMCGSFDQSKNTMELNCILLDNPKELVNTIAHELRHAYQYQRAMNPESLTDMLYRLNFDNYISPVCLGNGKYLYYTDYQDQLVEAEARAFAKQFSKTEAAF